MLRALHISSLSSSSHFSLTNTIRFSQLHVSRILSHGREKEINSKRVEMEDLRNGVHVVMRGCDETSDEDELLVTQT